MIVFIFFIFRVLLLIAINIEAGITSFAQDTVPSSAVRVDSVFVPGKQAEINMVLDSTMKAVEVLEAIPKENKKVITRDRKLSKKMDRVYFNLILPLRYMEPLRATPVAIKIAPIQPIEYQFEHKCLDIEVKPVEVKKRNCFWQKLNPFKKRK